MHVVAYIEAVAGLTYSIYIRQNTHEKQKIININEVINNIHVNIHGEL